MISFAMERLICCSLGLSAACEACKWTKLAVASVRPTSRLGRKFLIEWTMSKPRYLNSLIYFVTPNQTNGA